MFFLQAFSQMGWKFETEFREKIVWGTLRFWESTVLMKNQEEIMFQYRGKLDHKIRYWSNLNALCFLTLS